MHVQRREEMGRPESTEIPDFRVDDNIRSTRMEYSGVDYVIIGELVKSVDDAWHAGIPESRTP